MKLQVIVHAASAEGGGYWAEVPSLPGCMSQGDTWDELQYNIREAIEGWLAAGRPGEPIGKDDQVLEIAV